MEGAMENPMTKWDLVERVFDNILRLAWLVFIIAMTYSAFFK
jgi:hypothetical protein